jgi:Tfp pilus assembly protein PilO
MKSSTKIFAVVLIGLCLTGGLYLFAISPMLGRVVELQQTVVNKKTELETLAEQIDTYKNSQADLATVGSTNAVSNSLLDREHLQEAIEEVEAAAGQTQVKESLQISDQELDPVVAGKTNLDEVPYQLSTTGTFAQTVQFLQYLEHLPHFTETYQIALSATQGASALDGTFTHGENVTGVIQSVFFVTKP